MLKTFEIGTDRIPSTPLTAIRINSRNLNLLQDGLRPLLPSPELVARLSKPEQDLVQTLQDTVDYYKCQNDQLTEPSNQDMLDTMAADLVQYLSMVFLRCFLPIGR